MIIAGFALICINILILLYRYIFASIHVQEIILTLNVWYILIVSILPFVWWLYSTKKDEWHFYNRKKTTLALCIANASMAIGQPIWTLVFDTIVMKICRIRTGRNLDAEMVFILCRFALMVLTGAFFAFVIAICYILYSNVEIKEMIENVRWQYIFDTRANKNEAYDLDYIRDMKTGRSITIFELDRFVHELIIGASGTGKTSSTILKSIVCDINQKVENMTKRLPKIMNFVRNGKGEVYTEPNRPVDEYSVVPKKEYEKELDDIKKRAPDCGVTFMAPDNETMEDVIKLTEVRNLPINVLDPAKEHTNKNVRMVGINPFYIDPSLNYKERQVDIVNKAQNAAEVLLAVSEIHGVGDQYFRDINQSVTTSVSIVCMLHANLNGRQTNISEIQSCIADFGRLRPIVDDIQNKLHMHIKVHEIAGSDAKKGSKVVDRDSIKEPTIDELATDDIVFDEAMTDDEVPAEYKALGMNAAEYNKRIREEGEGYAEPIHNVLMELLGAGAEFMFQQARGLRNILGNMLLNSSIRKALSAPDDALLDFDKAFLRGEITVINTAQEISTTSSTALGLFILLTMKQCALRRPKLNRINHFLYVDEASQYMHPLYEDMFAQFRKFKVGVALAVQSLSQFEKNATTKYLKGVLLGAGIHVVFGRIDPDTMKYYELLSGVIQKETVQQSVNSNSEFDADYKVSTGKRKAVEAKAAVEGADIRTRGFQEVTVFTVKNGKVQKGFHAKTSFVPKKEFQPRSLPTYDFRKYAKDNPKLAKIREISEQNENAKIELEKYKTSQKVTNIQNEEERIGTLPAFDAVEEVIADADKRLTEQKKASTDKVKQRKGDADMLLESVSQKSVYSKNHGQIDEEIELLPQSMLSLNANKPPKDKPIKDAHTRKESSQDKPKKTVSKDFDFGSLLSENTNPFGKEEKPIDEDIDDDALFDSMLAELNEDKKVF